MYQRRWLRGVFCLGLFASVMGTSQSALAQRQTRVTLPVSPVGSERAIETDRPEIDLVFVLDGTGSMGDEIGPVRDQLWSIANRVAEGSPRPSLRVGLVVYRDRQDREHTRMVPLTSNLGVVHAELMRTVATGGGDYPEDVYAGLSLAINEMSWRRRAARMVFLVGDAPPHEYGEHSLRELLRDARSREIEVSTIECSGMTPAGSALWSTIATRTNGVAEVLTYARDEQLADGSTHTVLRRGRETFVASRSLSESERSEGARALASRGLVRRASETELAGGYGDGAARGSVRRVALRGASATSSAAMASPTASASNNIDGVITRRVRARAARMGVTY